MRTATDVIERIKQVLKFSSDKELHHHLAIPKTTLSSWKIRNIVPYEICVQVSDQHGVTLDWLITGEGPMHRTPPSAPTPPPEPKPPEPPKKPVLRLVEMPKRPDSRLAMMLTWLESWWVKANSDERVWCDIQMTRCFPEYKDYRQAAESENDLEGGLDGA